LTTTTSPSYTDTNVPLTELRYRVRAVDIHGNVGSASNEIAIATPTDAGTTPSIPTMLTLLPNSPNPFEGTTSLHVGLPKAGEVRIEVYDVAGRRVATRTSTLSAGWRDVVFDGRGDNGQALASGVYFYRVHAAGETHTRKMVISR
jgi:FlgD Ig-like domain